jgi:hypothetical protein
MRLETPPGDVRAGEQKVGYGGEASIDGGGKEREGGGRAQTEN